MPPSTSAQQIMQLATQHHQAGRLVEAGTAYRQVLDREPLHADALHMLGVLAGQSGHAGDAIALIRQSLQIKPAYPAAYRNLALAFLQAGRLDEAIEALQSLADLTPADHEAQMALGQVLMQKGLADRALEAFDKSAALQPNMADVQAHRGDALSALGRFAEALPAYQRALQVQPVLVEGYCGMAVALAELGRYTDAVRAADRAVELAPRHASTHEARGLVLLRSKEMAGADNSFTRAVELAPDLATAWNGKGTALRALGKFEEAAACFRRAIQLRPDIPVFYMHLSTSGRQAADAAETQRLTELAQRPGASVEDRITSGFALGKLMDDADRFDEAFGHYTTANALVKARAAAGGERFDADLFHRQVERIIERFTPDFFASRRDWGDSSDVPVFIVGMPRSGTTLVEQIVASHPMALGAGELEEIGRISASLGADPSAWQRQPLRDAAAAHLKRLQELSRAGAGPDPASRVVDKMMGNVLELGLIAVLFPAARVIVCHRDARDNCLSCFFQHFSGGNLFAYDLVDCGRRCVEIDRLVNHWRGVLPLATLHVQYESLVADLEGQSRRLIEFLGLPWDPVCLKFHQTERTIVTASAWQVRQPIYHRSVNRWRHYQRHLGPLLGVLGDRLDRNAGA